MIDEVTAEHGVVTSVLVPGYRERIGETTHGSLDVAERAAWVATLAQRRLPERPRPAPRGREITGPPSSSGAHRPSPSCAAAMRRSCA